MDGTTNKHLSYLRPRPLQVPGRTLDHILFPNCPKFPELDQIKLPESDASQEASAGPSELKSISASSVVASETPKKPAVKLPAAKTVQSSSDPLPARSSTAFPRKQRASSQPANKKITPVTTKVPADASDLKSDESSEDRSDSEGSLDETGITSYGAAVPVDSPGNLDSSSKTKGLEEEQKSMPAAAIAFVSVLIFAFLIIMAVLLAPEGSDRHHGADSDGHLHPSGSTGGKQGRSGEEEASKEDEPTGELGTALPQTASTRKRPFNLAGYGDANAPDGDAASPECDTESCRWESRLVNEMLNATVDPCEDFYAYVCSSAWERSSDDLPYRAAGHAFLINEVTRYLQEHAHSVPYTTTKDVIHSEHNFLDHASIVLSGCLKNAVPKGVHNWDGIRGLLRDVGLENWPYVEPTAAPFSAR
ncbi:hypothetical protein HPB50_007742 [Hyalomma asiaticum]|uniref:Uncharacterized protein n=1 Tax=Hyalomma asiaticum TaxID=266040 RepID=A0ACB7RIE5_HYAAI|nr:hypothetical protein HPB50_007742 [Hyalomma asiaticum]